MRRLILAMTGALALAGCGEDIVLRPLDLSIQGVSSQAALLIVQLLPGPDAPQCVRVTPANVATEFRAPIRLVWARDSGSERVLTAPPLETERVTVIAHTEDAAGTVIQLGCREVDYLALESPEVRIVLISSEP